MRRCIWAAWATMRCSGIFRSASVVPRAPGMSGFCVERNSMSASIHPPVHRISSSTSGSYFRAATASRWRAALRPSLPLECGARREGFAARECAAVRFGRRHGHRRGRRRSAVARCAGHGSTRSSPRCLRSGGARTMPGNNGEQPVPFTWAEVKFGAGLVIAIRMKDSSHPARGCRLAARARQLLVCGGCVRRGCHRRYPHSRVREHRGGAADAHRTNYLESQLYWRRTVLKRRSRPIFQEVDLAMGEGWTDEPWACSRSARCAHG